MQNNRIDKPFTPETVTSPYNEKELKMIKEGGFYSLLEKCTKEELEPLVSYIKSKFSEYLTIHVDYKKHNPDHTKYSNVIGDEIRMFGGDTFSNLMRGGNGPSYDEILYDVCKKLDIPVSDKNETIENESKLLKIYLPYNWKNLSPEDQEKAVESAKNACSTNGGVGYAVTGVATAATRIVTAPIGGILTVKGMTAPAFSITVPCVIHIAYLRQKVIDRLTRSIKPSPTQQQYPIVFASDSPLIIGESSDKPMLTLSLAKVLDTDSIKWQSVSDNDNTGISRWNSLLQAVPNLTTKAQTNKTQYVECNIPLESLSLVKGSTTTYRGFTRDSSGKFAEHVELSKPEKLTSMVNMAALYQIASVVVAQKYLADIDEKLDKIKKIVEEISDFQNNDRESKITGAIDYFEQISTPILMGKHNSYRNQIEYHESQLLSVHNHLIKDIEKCNNDIDAIENPDSFGTEGLKKSIKVHQDKIDNLYKQLSLCIRARAYGWQLLLAAFPNEVEIIEVRKKSIYESLVKVSKLLNNTISKMHEKIHNFSAFSNTKITLNARKLDLMKSQDILLKNVKNTSDEIRSNIRSIEAISQGNRAETKVLLKIENDKVVGRSPL